MKALWPLPIALALSTAPCLAQGEADIRSTSWIAPGCRAIVADQTETSPLKAGVCGGSVATLMFVGDALPPPYRVCPPGDATLDQAVRIVVDHFEARPTRWHEPFVVLALEGLSAAWPCR